MTLTEAYAAFGITRFTEIASSNKSEDDRAAMGYISSPRYQLGLRSETIWTPTTKRGFSGRLPKFASSATRSGPGSSSRRKRRLGQSSTGSGPGP